MLKAFEMSGLGEHGGALAKHVRGGYGGAPVGEVPALATAAASPTGARGAAGRSLRRPPPSAGGGGVAPMEPSPPFEPDSFVRSVMMEAALAIAQAAEAISRVAHLAPPEARAFAAAYVDLGDHAMDGGEADSDSYDEDDEDDEDGMEVDPALLAAAQRSLYATDARVAPTDDPENRPPQTTQVGEQGGHGKAPLKTRTSKAVAWVCGSGEEADEATDKAAASKGDAAAPAAAAKAKRGHAMWVC